MCKDFGLVNRDLKMLLMYPPLCVLFCQAMGWCPWQGNIIATGGGWKDGELRIWDTQSASCVTSVQTNSQVLENYSIVDIFVLLYLKMLDKLLLFTLICRSVLYNGLKRRDIWLQVMAYLITKSHLGCGSFTLSAPFTSSQVRKPKNTQDCSTLL